MSINLAGIKEAVPGWNDNQWYAKLTPGERWNFKGARYMDDILLITRKSKPEEGWNREEFITKFTESQCYSKPLKLEYAGDKVFLETEFRTDGKLEWQYRLKNDNATERKVWRYHHNNSALPFEMKKATLFAILRKVQHMASDKRELFASACDKLNEFAELQYSCGLRKFVCAIMARDYNNTVWRYVRSLQD